MTQHGGDSDRMPDLADLIQAKMDEGVSMHELARRTRDRIDHQTISRWRNREMTQCPRDSGVFEAFSDVLGVNVDQVLLSMAVQLGVPVKRPASTAAFLPPDAERLTDDQRRALRMLIKSIVEAPPAAAPSRDEVALAAHTRKRPAPPSEPPKDRRGRHSP